MEDNIVTIDLLLLLLSLTTKRMYKYNITNINLLSIIVKDKH